MKTLLQKELRAQLPFLLLIGFLFLLNVAEHVIGRFPDARSLAGILNEHNEGGTANGVLYLILATSLALTLLPRERDEGTLEFLDALPCTRGRVFLAKALVGAFILGLYPLLDNATGLVVHRLAHSSLDQEWPVRLVVEMLLIESCVCFALLGVGLALSFFRRFAFFVIGLLIAIYMALSAAEVPWIHLLDFTEPIRYSFRAGQIAIAWRQLGVTMALGFVGYTVAWMVFGMQGDRSTRVMGWVERHHLRGPITIIGTIGMVVVWIGVAVKFAASQADAEGEGADGRVSYRSWQTSQMKAGDYIFLYPANLRSRAASLAAEASEVHRKVRDYFGAESAGEIVADLNSELRHVAATAEWKRINMSIVETDELEEQIAVLGHETAHVYIDFLSEGRLRQSFRSTRWWHEGLASHLEYRFYRPAEDLARIQRVAAAAHRRKASEFELLVNDSAWRVKHDPDLAYPLGEVFLEELVAEHGSESPGKILRAIVRPNGPDRLFGLDLWRDAFQACGWDLSTTVSGYYRRLQAFAESEYKDFVDSLPRLRGRVLTDAKQVRISVIPSAAVPEDCELHCRIRRFADAADTDYQYLEETEARQFSIGRKWVGHGEFWYQLGIGHPDAQFTIFEDWQRARVQ